MIVKLGDNVFASWAQGQGLVRATMQGTSAIRMIFKAKSRCIPNSSAPPEPHISLPCSLQLVENIHSSLDPVVTYSL